MADATMATAADYADAMLTARRAKNWLFLFLLLILLLQLAVFFLYHYDVLHLTATTTRPAAASIPQATPQYLTRAFVFLGIFLAVVASMVLLLITNIMLVGRLLGVARL